ncbi:MAG TPA: hypothetical protein VMW38_15445 [Terriglobia bacterium]|nr:hypothetical protein [Terriglobia bacterium]
MTYAGALLISVATGDLSGISVAARTSAAGGGNNPFIAYAVIDDGGVPGDHSGDDAFIASSP